MRPLLPCLVVLIASSLSCGEQDPLTEIVVVVDTDIVGLERITLGVGNFSDGREAEATLRDVDPILPRRVGLVHDGGPLGPITITARAIDDDLPGSGLAVERRASLYFQRGKVLRLDMALTQDCVAVYESCEGGKTCIDGKCELAGVTPGMLTNWSGTTPGRVLAARSDGSGASSPMVGTDAAEAAGAAGAAPGW